MLLGINYIGLQGLKGEQVSITLGKYSCMSKPCYVYVGIENVIEDISFREFSDFICNIAFCKSVLNLLDGLTYRTDRKNIAQIIDQYWL